jgi:hypothetical protein
MLENYFGSVSAEDSTKERRRRVMAVNAALEIIKAAVSASPNSKNTDFELEQAAKHLGPLADAIQSAVEKD